MREPKKVTNTTKTVKKNNDATPLMKKVAVRSYGEKNAKKVFSPDEIQDILKRRRENLELSDEEKMAVRETYRKIKRRVKDMEATNQQRVIVFPSFTNGDGWYKAIEFSALYYAYRLADRMGRSARVMRDTDKFSKARYAVSITNIESFVEQFKRLEDVDLQVTEDGIYIFALKKPVPDDEVAQLRQVEETRREKMHNVLRPKAMDPAVFNAIMMLDRQLVPRIKKLQTPYFTSIGCSIVVDIKNLLAVYGKLNDGIYDRREAGVKLLEIADEITAGLTLLAEIRVWPYDTATIIGENVAQLKRLIIKDFNVRIGDAENG